MAGRPPNPTLIEHTDKKWFQTKVVASDELWVVTYQKQPIKIKRDSLAYDMVLKYSLEVFTSENRARKRADQFNTQFNTLDFGCMKLL